MAKELIKSPAKNSLGQTEYSPKLCAEIAKLMAAGMSNVQVMAMWGVSKKTFYAWKRNHEEFAEAADIGENMFNAQHEKLGVEGMLKTRDIDYNFWKDLGKFRNGWSEKERASINNNTQINIDSINIFKEQSDEELIEYIKSNIAELPEVFEGEIIEATEHEQDETS